MAARRKKEDGAVTTARRPRKKLSAVDPAALHRELNLNEFVLDGKPVDVALADAITDGEIAATIEGASTLTLNVRDAERVIVTSGVFKHGARLKAADHLWALAQIRKTGDDFDLIFEDERVFAMRQHRGKKKVFRNKVTRAEFIRSRALLVKSPRMRFVSPELHKKQPVGKGEADQPQRDKDRKPGFQDKPKFTIKGQIADAHQVHQVQICMTTAHEVDAPRRAVMGMLVAGIGESQFRTSAAEKVYGTHKGVFQSNQIPANQTDTQCYHFLTGGRSFLAGGAIKYVEDHPNASPGEIAQAVEISDGSAGYYNGFKKEASNILKLWDGGFIDELATERRVAKKYPFMQGPPDGPKDEDAWSCTQRLAAEVAWRAFIVGDTFYYSSEQDLIRSRPRMAIEEGQGGIDWIDYDIDVSQRVSANVTVTCRMDIWKAPPGSVVQIDDEGPAKGRWLVRTIRRNLFNYDGEIEMVRKGELLKEEKEPAPEYATKQINDIAGHLENISGNPTPKTLLENAILPIGKIHNCHACNGGPLNARNVTTCNHNHNANTTSGNRSDHNGPPDRAWAADMFGSAKDMKALANDLSETFDLNWSASNPVVQKTIGKKGEGQYRVQMLHLTTVGGDHFSHVHFGIARV